MPFVVLLTCVALDREAFLSLNLPPYIEKGMAKIIETPVSVPDNVDLPFLS